MRCSACARRNPCHSCGILTQLWQKQIVLNALHFQLKWPGAATVHAAMQDPKWLHANIVVVLR